MRKSIKKDIFTNINKNSLKLKFHSYTCIQIQRLILMRIRIRNPVWGTQRPVITKWFIPQSSPSRTIDSKNGLIYLIYQAYSRVQIHSGLEPYCILWASTESSCQSHPSGHPKYCREHSMITAPLPVISDLVIFAAHRPRLYTHFYNY